MPISPAEDLTKAIDTLIDVRVHYMYTRDKIIKAGMNQEQVNRAMQDQAKDLQMATVDVSRAVSRFGEACVQRARSFIP